MQATRVDRMLSSRQARATIAPSRAAAKSCGTALGEPKWVFEGTLPARHGFGHFGAARKRPKIGDAARRGDEKIAGRHPVAGLFSELDAPRLCLSDQWRSNGSIRENGDEAGHGL